MLLNQKFSELKIFPFALIFLFVNPILAFAQSASDDAGSQNGVNPRIPLIYISASRTPKPAKEVGSSITTFSNEEIESRQINFVDEILREVPSVAVSQNGGTGGLTNIRIRGAESNHTLFLLDGIKLNNPSFDNRFQIEHLPVGIVEQVEVLRGAQSSIHGTEAVGGVVSFTSRTPVEGSEGKANLQLGSRNTTQSNLYFGHSSDMNFLSLGVSSYQTDGFSRLANDPEPDGYENTSALIKLGGNITNEFSLSATGLFINADGDFDPGVQSYELDKHAISLMANYEQIAGMLKHTLRISNTENRSDYFKDGAENGYYDSTLRFYGYQGELKIPDSENTVVFAMESEEQIYKRDHPFGNLNRTTRPTVSYILEYQSVVGDNLFLSLSGRHDDNSENGFQNYDTYRGSIAYLVGETDTRIHASYGTGVKNPTITELFGWRGTFEGNPDLEPETSKNWDLGVEFPLGRDGLFDITYFNNDVTNFIGTAPGNWTSGPPINLPGVNTINGFELAYRGVIAENFHTTFSFSDFNSEDKDGEELIRRPTRQMSVNVNRPITIGGYPGDANVNIQYTGKIKDDDFSTWPATRLSLPSRTLVNVSSNVNLRENMQLTFKIENLFDKKDYQDVLNYAVAGRSVFAGVNYRF